MRIARLETFKSRVDDETMLYVRRVQASGDSAVVSAQLFGMEE